MQDYSEHRYGRVFRHRFLIWGIVSMAVLFSLPLFLSTANTGFLYSLAVGMFFFYVFLDLMEAKLSAVVKVYPQSISIGNVSVPYNQIKYVHGESSKQTDEVFNPAEIIIVYGERSQLVINKRISGFRDIVRTFHAHEIPNNL